MISLPLQKLPDDCFKPFIFDGFVSLTGKAEDQRLGQGVVRRSACPVSHSLWCPALG